MSQEEYNKFWNWYFIETDLWKEIEDDTPETTSNMSLRQEYYYG